MRACACVRMCAGMFSALIRVPLKILSSMVAYPVRNSASDLDSKDSSCDRLVPVIPGPTVSAVRAGHQVVHRERFFKLCWAHCGLPEILRAPAHEGPH